MGKWLDCGWRDPGEVVNDNVSGYVFPGGGPPETDQLSSADRPLRHAGTASNIRVLIEANTVTGASTWTLLGSQVATSLSASITASTTGWFEDISNTATLAAADEIAYEIDTPLGGTSLTLKMYGMEFDSDSDTVTLLGCSSSGTSGPAAGVTTYFQIIGGRDGNTEAFTQYQCGAAGTWQDMFVATGNNTISGNTTLRSRLNGVNGNQVIVVATGNNGIFEDTSNTDTVAVDDLLAVQAVGDAGTGAFVTEKIGGSLVSTNDEWITAIHGNNYRLLDGATGYWPIRGELTPPEATETDAQIEASFAFTAKKMISNINRMVGTVNVTYVLRVNGADGNSTTAHSATGIVEDASNTDSISAGDDLNFKVSSPVGGTNFDTQFIGLIGENSAVAAGPNLAGSLGTLGVGY